MITNHPWKLVSPWYRWNRQLVVEGRKPRQTRPIFQKFDHSDFVKSFIRDPQHSLKFKDDIDKVFNVKLTDIATPQQGIFAGKFTRLFVPNPEKGSEKIAKDASLVPTGIRKLFLDTHKRYYLVVCELHCDAPGFPSVKHNQVCQAGFVVRRRSYEFPQGARKEAIKYLQDIVGIQAELAHLEETVPARGSVAKKRAQLISKMRAEGKLETKKAELREKLRAARLELLKWKEERGVIRINEGWIPSRFENIGSWQMVEEHPQEILETTFPFYPLFADPNIADHSAMGKTMYFGVVPTSSLDTEENGNARFDDQVRYEIRCFVRRHKEGCPRRDEAPDCPGEIVWSESTEVYKLASHNDLVGTSQRPVTIQMPNLAELAAQVAAFPLHKFSPVKVVQPQTLKFDVNDGKPVGGGVFGFQQICFFAIPLITIVALFVLNLFLPIVVFLFGLFFLLRLKFCILPNIEIDAGIDAELDAFAPRLEAIGDLNINVDVPFDPFLNLDFTVEDLHASLKAAIAANAGITAANDVDQLDNFSNSSLLPLGQGIKSAMDTPLEEAHTIGVDLVGSLEYEPRVNYEEVRVS